MSGGVYGARRVLVCLALMLALAATAAAQGDLSYYLPAGTKYSPAVPAPPDVLGFVPGERHVHHHQLVAYLQAVDAASDRVTMERTGTTHGGRPLYLLTISSPRNLARIEAIRTEHLKMAPPTDESPVVVWMGYSVHGNEPSGANAVPLVVYHLAAAEGPEIDALLDKAVIVVEPAINPDGLDRFAHWANTLRGRNPVADPNHREHLETWPGGRTNYYHFDLNRDWVPVQQPESRQRLRQFHRWKPNVVTDHHEMGSDSTFFFQPGIPSRNFPLSPPRGFDLTARVSEYHARLLDPIGSLYYRRESFDDFYIGKGSTYPDILGSVGILFEQASSRGHVQRTDHGLLTFPFTIRHQFLATLSTLHASVDLRLDLLAHQRELLNGAAREAAAHTVKAYVFGDAHDAARVWHLVDLLHHHEIRVHRLGEPVTVDGRTFDPATSFVVPLDQPHHRLVRGLFETRTEFEDRAFYDISTWTLPLAFNLEAAPLAARAMTPGLLGPDVGLPAFPSGAVVGGRSEYAYVLAWDGYYAPRALNRLLAAGVRVKVAQRPFTVRAADGSTHAFTYGALLVALGIQARPDDVHAIVETIAHDDALQVVAVPTGLNAEGIDLGSPSFAPVRAPRVMLLTGSGVAANDAGEIWHQLDVRWGMPLSQVDVDVFNRVALDDYTAIVLAAGGYPQMTEAAVEKLRRWVAGGGTLIVYRTAVAWAIRQKLLAASVVDATVTPDPGLRRYVDAPSEAALQTIAGSIFEADIDPSHPLLYGYRSTRVPTFRNTTLMLEVPANPYAAPMRYRERPLLSGYVSPEQLERLKGTAAVVVGAIGEGRVVAATDNPVFRAFWFGTDKLLANAIFFGSTVAASTTAR